MKTIVATTVVLLLFAQVAPAQTGSDQGNPKVNITGMNFSNPDAKGLFQVYISLQANTCREHIPVGYSIQTFGVRLPSEAIKKIRPQIDDIERDLAKDCEMHR